MLMSIVVIIVISALLLIPRALLVRAMEQEYKRLFDPRCKREKLFPFLIPYQGGMKLCEAIGAMILSQLSRLMCVVTIVCVINTTIMRLMGITEGWYPVISIYYNVATFLLNYMLLVMIAHRSAVTIQSPVSAALCFIPPLSFYMQSSLVKHFFRVNKDELKGTFTIK